MTVTYYIEYTINGITKKATYVTLARARAAAESIHIQTGIIVGIQAK